MCDKPLHVLAANVTAACAKFQAALADGAPQSVMPSSAPHPSVAALEILLREQQQLVARLKSGEQSNVQAEDKAEVAMLAAKRERVLEQGLHALGAVAVSMRAVLDDVEELVPVDNGYLPSVQELLSYGHRLRYTTFATTGLYSGEPAPQQLHFDHAALWERALAERHQQMAAAAAATAGAANGAPTASPAVEVDPRAEAACRTLLNKLVEAGWTPQAGFPEPVLAFLSDMPGALDVLRRLVEERFFGGVAGAGTGAAAEASGAAAAAAPPPPRPAAATAAPANAASRLVRELMLDEDTDEEGSSSDYTTSEEGSD
ncbi:hypothetical protein Agub_g10642 [Astrephomene gubernaculifera]|uniref:Uncharacterized protein n=1 Tax=Astrephomene gubernaculifera TaxID=47775 RepID=A0AAD3DXR0_9CHLO|nr:hypothetical protein Agub_g10642 [Astrephomene gubernaculifera]